MAEPMAPNETWVISKVDEVRVGMVETIWTTENLKTLPMILPTCKDAPTLILYGFQSSTKELLHTYGPFHSPGELIDFVKAHAIVLE